MTVQAILAPVFAQVLLTFALLFWMGRARLGAVRGGEARGRELSMGQRNWPAPAQQAANTFSNQFEIPVLFYVLVGFAMATRKADLLFVVLAWVFVATRFLHAGVYLTTNHVPYRFRAYAAGTLVLLAMWIVFAVRIFSAPIGL
ncbi:MAPEG family protein [Methylobacterium sp. J-068]|uniref:MAPEG family protein n=1 Tax=Methylobacterium sp. J-068 TaxID=2836649 RepID=UPI001FBB0E12|nr:MAPEG family protein [Methylobacterium sp. J-068]MCJ2037183.1 MAPEG family protein [Methylobacterium sp. J-068]